MSNVEPGAGQVRHNSAWPTLHQRLNRSEGGLIQETLFVTRRWLLIIPLLCLSLVVCSVTYWLTWQRNVHELRGNAGARVERYAGSLKSTLDRYEFLPYLLSLHPFIHQLLLVPNNSDNVRRANDYLVGVNQRAKASAAYLVDVNGLALAASNWRDAATFVGQHYQFRPYFCNAVAGGIGRFYGVGTTTGEPGYFVSQPVWVNGHIRGVVVVKLNLEWFQKAGADASEPVVVADEHDVVFLSSMPAWQYHSLHPLSAAVTRTLESSRQYYNQHITPLPIEELKRIDADGEIVALGKQRYLAVHRRLGEPNWQLIYFTPLDEVAANARNAAIAAAFACGFAWLLMFYWRQRRLRLRDMMKNRAQLQAAYARLNERVALRTADLRAANEQLQTEVQERTRAEQELRQAQSELVQASKLAALGQMAAGITHELNQPLAALRSFSDNTRVLIERGETGAARENLEAIAALTDRMGKITGQLRLFAGKSRPHAAQASVRRAIDNTLSLLGARLKLDNIQVVYRVDGGDCEVVCDSLSLEQVLINLISNGVDAVRGGANPRIDVSIDATPSIARITVRDNGLGISGEVMPRLFEPFFTTKEGGHGMGLGLAISSSIAQAYGGRLSAANVAGGAGAEFILTLRRVRDGAAEATIHDVTHGV